jgi:hypothetical protein
MKKLWNDKIFDVNLNNTFLSKDLLNKYLNKFWLDIVMNINDNEHILFIPRLILIDNQYISLSKLLKINKDNKDEIISFLNDLMDLSNEAYTNIPIKSIIFSYGIRKGKIISEFSNKTLDGAIKYQVYYKNKLPIPSLPLGYGKLISKNDKFYLFSSPLNKNTFINLIQEKEDGYLVNSITYIKNDNILFIWKDKILSDNKFIRFIGKSTIHSEDGEANLTKIERKTTGMTNKVLPKNNSVSNKFLTMDIETVLINNNHVPYLLCWFDGTKSYSYFLGEYFKKGEILLELENSYLNNYINLMIKDAMEDINRKKYKNYKIYLHNFAKFDGMFLIKYLAQLGYCKPVIHKGKLISCKFNLLNNKQSVTFLDSYLLIPASLRDLCKSFDVIEGKGIFPFLLNNINYLGFVPEYQYFDKNSVSLEECNIYKSQFGYKLWSFRDESIKYCSLDCISLYKVLVKFNELIFNKFSLNITKYPTLPSLAFGIFRTHFLIKKEDINKDKEGNLIKTPSKIHMLSGKIAEDIRNGYTGGAVDMYIPNNNPGDLVYGYDVNALYPYVMMNKKMPIGAPTYFEGNIIKTDPNVLGFFYCKIIAPDNLLHPILQIHVKTNEGVRTIAPTGTWEGIYFSEELINALKFGYKFEVLWGYTFKSAYVFKDSDLGLVSVALANLFNLAFIAISLKTSSSPGNIKCGASGIFDP